MLIYKSVLLWTMSNNNFNYILNEIYQLSNIISGKYLIITLFLCFYISYHSTSDKILFSSYTSDNYNDILLNNITKIVIKQSKFSTHIINNKVLHPITVFLQNF